MSRMKPLMSDMQDDIALQELGRASVQIVHDLKNQINGLKLYATFLRKRLEASNRPADELDTLSKINAGLERAAADMSALVRYGRPVELRRQPQVDLAQILASAVDGATLTVQDGDYRGEFDTTVIKEALKTIQAVVHTNAAMTREMLETFLRHEEPSATRPAPHAVIEWRGVDHRDEKLFASFAGSNGLRLALAAKFIRAHGGTVEQEGDVVRARLPLTKVSGTG